jgi:hypothetical protein
MPRAFGSGPGKLQRNELRLSMHDRQPQVWRQVRARRGCNGLWNGLFSVSDRSKRSGAMRGRHVQRLVQGRISHLQRQLREQPRRGELWNELVRCLPHTGGRYCELRRNGLRAGLSLWHEALRGFVYHLQRSLFGPVPDRHPQLLRGLRSGRQHGLVWDALHLLPEAGWRQSNHLQRRRL